MKPTFPRACALALLFATTFTLSAIPLPSPAAQSDSGDKGGKGRGGDERGGGNGKGKGNQDRDDRGERGDRDDRGRQEQRQDRGGSSQVQSRSSGPSVEVYFDDRRRVAVREYYGEQIRSGKCPPGLAKKNNGCMPPGQAKKWNVGRPLPRDVVYYDVPQSLVVRLGAPPSGHRYVRVAADILLIAVGTSMVIDAIQDLGSM